MIKIKQLVGELKIQVQKSRPNTKYKSIMDIISKLEHEILSFEGNFQANTGLDKTSIEIESKNIPVEEEIVIIPPTIEEHIEVDVEPKNISVEGEIVITSPTKTPKTKK